MENRKGTNSTCCYGCSCQLSLMYDGTFRLAAHKMNWVLVSSITFFGRSLMGGIRVGWFERM